MTNEELAELIREGNDGLIPQLWEQVQVYVRRKAETAMRSIPPEHGVEVDDLAQSGYFALLEAVATFDREKGTFLCWLEKYLKTEFAVAGGYRTSAATRSTYLPALTGLYLLMTQTGKHLQKPFQTKQIPMPTSRNRFTWSSFTPH